ncbi:MAG: YbaB/EbfC family nucleoid-associated protein [Desulfofustis sp.]|jgi:nucleoid-associated protein EbfC
MDFTSIMQQAREMQEKMNRVQEELASKTVTGSAGGGMVTVQATGKGEIISISIEDEVIDAAEKELLQDLVSGAVNDALRKARDLAKAEMAGLAGGVQIPGLTNMF